VTRREYSQLLLPARQRAFGPGEFVGQESFMRATEILELAQRGGIGSGTEVLDLCCGVAGPGNHIARSLGSRHLGVDRNPEAVELAREGATGLPSVFMVGDALHTLPPRPAEVVLLLETVLAFPDKPALLAHVWACLKEGGRFVFTLEEGLPLNRAEQKAMPEADTVQLIPRQTMERYLREQGFEEVQWRERSRDHLATAGALLHEFRRLPAPPELVRSHELWVDWLASGRVSKWEVVGRKKLSPSARATPNPASNTGAS
jgi:sarcosine/dimethylglycine N-methyltransferase